MERLFDWLASLSHLYVIDIIRSAALVLLLVVVRTMVMRAISANPNVPLEVRRRWSISLRNGLVILGLIGMVTIWAKQLETIALSMVAFAAALVVATKELFMCVGGSLIRTTSNSFDLGDHIEIANLRGRVVDINLFSTTIMEIGPRHDAHQLTGRAVSFPNSLLLSHPVVRENYMGDYVVHVTTVAVPYSVPPAQAERLLKAAAEEACAPHVQAARQHMERIAARHLVDTPSVEPRIAIFPIDDKRYNLILRISIPAKDRHRVEQAILHQFMCRCFPEKAVEQ
ncbi:mechanosensitive ion channel domain-containing protein [Pseudogulbenkiania subflava]|uniref:Small-conductance mechanosensitive channel n=1 Tax=Pseudogulbenkiania subflava DSM 22618 TaxID=1123014 RepID=A0A1Y6BJ61_9NEIS|nr:mechanosensitive ion channel domain-containing protein [Pseudogulbenkiania subflava]SMF10539.1 Mechanosensitive ion channel [Pseudogulbenkiania subflava DSM 22618]